MKRTKVTTDDSNYAAAQRELTRPLLLHPRTQALYDAVSNRPAASVLVSGAPGSGSRAAALQLCRDTLDHKNALTIVEPEKSTIGIAQIRELKQQFTSKLASTKIGRAGLIYEAQSMTTEAQNALLKLLEEPPAKSLIVLHARSEYQLLDTIRSRCVSIPILPISKPQAVDYAHSHAIEKQSAVSAHAISAGNASLYMSIVHGEDTDMSALIDTAKQYIGQSVFDRLSSAKTYATQEAIQELIKSLLLISTGALHHGSPQSVDRWARAVRTCQTAQRSLAARTSPKLVYTYLSTHL